MKEAPFFRIYNKEENDRRISNLLKSTEYLTQALTAEQSKRSSEISFLPNLPPLKSQLRKSMNGRLSPISRASKNYTTMIIRECDPIDSS